MLEQKMTVPEEKQMFLTRSNAIQNKSAFNGVF